MMELLPDIDIEDKIQNLRSRAESGEFAHLSSSQRAMIAAELSRLGILQRHGKQVEKDAWIAKARSNFSPGPAEDCCVCGRYRSVCEAHHIYPLSLQFDSGVKEPIHEFYWLCPTHHSALHLYLSALQANVTMPSLLGFESEERDALSRLTVRFVQLKYLEK